jgi:CHRD domain-containing protein
MRRTVRIAAGIAAAVSLAAFAISCGDSNGPTRPTYTATLLGTTEVPSNTSTGTGTATFIDNGTSMDYFVEVHGLTAITGSHIHGPASATTNAGIIVNLFNPIGPPYGQIDGVIATGTITDANNASITLTALRAMFDAGTAYVNVHTTALPGGAIRGMVVRSN